MISAIAVIDQENTYNRYRDGIVLKYAKMVLTHTIRNTQDPRMTIIIGITLFPSPLEAEIALSINADTQ